MPNEDSFTNWYELGKVIVGDAEVFVKDVFTRWQAQVAFDAGWDACNMAPYEYYERD